MIVDVRGILLYNSLIGCPPPTQSYLSILVFGTSLYKSEGYQRPPPHPLLRATYYTQHIWRRGHPLVLADIILQGTWRELTSMLQSTLTAARALWASWFLREPCCSWSPGLPDSGQRWWCPWPSPGTTCRSRRGNPCNGEGRRPRVEPAAGATLPGSACWCGGFQLQRLAMGTASLSFEPERNDRHLHVLNLYISLLISYWLTDWLYYLLSYNFVKKLITLFQILLKISG